MSHLGETVVGEFLSNGINFITILLYLVLSTFLLLWLSSNYGVFFFWPINCVSVDFFNWYDKVDLFFPIYIYIFPLDSDSLYIFIFELLAFIFPSR